MKLKLLAAALLAGVAFSASAADNSYTIGLGTTEFQGIGTLLEGGSDTITFEGLAAGTYNVILSYQGNLVNIENATLNSLGASYNIHGNYLSLGGFVVSTNSPFSLTLTGPEVTWSDAQYHGAITVSAVPEPATYGMLLGGLGLLGLASRRKKQS